jgi:transcriptional regulator with XRE-family HTH domain
MPSSHRAQPLDGEAIAVRRERLGISQRQLAHRTGAGYVTIRRLELGEAPNIDIHVVAALVRELETTMDQLWAGRKRASTITPDSVLLEALLHASSRRLTPREVQVILDWPRSRVDAAADDLCARAQNTGTIVHRSLKGMRIGPRHGILDAKQIDRLRATRRTRSELTAAEARVLYEIAHGTFVMTKSIGGKTRAAIGALKLNGMVSESDGTYQLTPAVSFSLGLRSSGRKPGSRKPNPNDAVSESSVGSIGSNGDASVRDSSRTAAR